MKQVIFADIDNTLSRSDRVDALQRLSETCMKQHVDLIAVTGNDFNSVYKRILAKELPYFFAVVASAGTEIYILKNKTSYIQDKDWSKRLVDTGFDRKEIVTVVQKNIEILNTEHPEWNIIPQHIPEEKFKVSLWYAAQSLQQAEKIADLLSLKFPGIRTHWCTDIYYTGEPHRFCFDFLAADKADAVNYIFQYFYYTEGLVCGDSGNDISMILETDQRLIGVVVGGSTEELINVIQNTDSHKSIYIETNQNNLGPDSIIHAAKLYLSNIYE